jgi:DNA-binding MarR family transcriptional regulator
MTRPDTPVDAWEGLFRAQVTLMREFSADHVWQPASMREYDVLFTLAREGDRALRLSALNDNVLMSQSSLSRLVERLEQRGWLERTSDPDDRRGTLVRLSEEGRAVQRRVGARHAARIRELMTVALDDDELAQLERLTRKLQQAPVLAAARKDCPEIDLDTPVSEQEEVSR